MNRVRTNRPIRSRVAFAILIAAAGCSDSKSSRSVETSEIDANFTAIADGSGSTKVSARLVTQDPGVIVTINRDVELKGRDRLIATYVNPDTLKAVNKKMIEEKSGGQVSYSRTFAGESKDAAFEINFKRGGSGREKAPNSRVTLPTPFVLDWVEDPVALIPAPINFSRSSATPYFVIWDPFDAPDFEPGDNFTYSVTGSCIVTRRGFIDWQSGEDTLELTGVLQDAAPPNAGMSCPLVVKLSLQRRGYADGAYDGGSFFGEQVRVLTLISSP